MSSIADRNAADATDYPLRFSNSDLVYALENAAEFLENEEWPERDGGQQVAANRAAAKRIRRMAARQWARFQTKP